MKETAQTIGSCSHGATSPSAIFFPKFHAASTDSHPDDQDLIKSRDASAERVPAGGEEPFAVWQAQQYPWCISGPLEPSWEALKLQPQCPCTPHAVSPVPKPASLKIAWVPLCADTSLLLKILTNSHFFNSYPVWMIPEMDNQNLSFLALSHFSVDSKSKCLCYKIIQDFMKELVQIHSCFTSKSEGRIGSGKQQVWVVLSGKIPYLRTSSPDSQQKWPLSSPHWHKSFNGKPGNSKTLRKGEIAVHQKEIHFGVGD